MPMALGPCGDTHGPRRSSRCRWEDRREENVPSVSKPSPNPWPGNHQPSTKSWPIAEKSHAKLFVRVQNLM